ncbi:SC5A5-like protein, partial [Mya arenaria]
MTTTFAVGDYIVFIGTVIISFGIGVFFWFRENKKKHDTTEDYFLAGRKSKTLPVTLSFVVTFQSSIMVLALPAEGYVYGMKYLFLAISGGIAFIFTAFFVVPVFHPLKLTSIYEYFNIRYGDNILRYVTMSIGVIYYLFYMGTVTYGTSVALEVVMGIPYWATIIGYITLTAIYTSIGGIRAVIWTDCFQFVIMVIGFIAIIVKGTIDAGGPGVVVSTDRFSFNEFSADPRIRYTFWNLSFGSIIYWLYYSYSQAAMQRVAAFSTLSSCLSSLAAIAYEDVIIVRYPNITPAFGTKISKILSLVFGAVAMGISFIISVMPGSIQAISQSIFACMDGPMCMIFILSPMFKRSTTKGLLAGAIVGMVVVMWLNMGKLFFSVEDDQSLPYGPTHNCDIYRNENDTATMAYKYLNCSSSETSLITNTTQTVDHSYPQTKTLIQHIYSISYVWFSLIGFIFSMVVGIVASLLTTPLTNVNPMTLFSWDKHIKGELCGGGCDGDDKTPPTSVDEEMKFLSKNE